MRDSGDVLFLGGGKWIPPWRIAGSKNPRLSGTLVQKESPASPRGWISINLKARILLIRLLGFGDSGNKNEGY